MKTELSAGCRELKCVTRAANGCNLLVHLTPRAKRDAILGLFGDALKVSIVAPPVDGKANEYLVKFISKSLGLSKRSVSLIQGETSRRKLLSIENISYEKLSELVAALLPAGKN